MNIHVTTDAAVIAKTAKGLLSKADLKKIPTISKFERLTMEERRDPVLHVHLRGITTGDWYIAAATPCRNGDVLCFGYVANFGHEAACDEWGSFSLRELAAMRFSIIPLIERDHHFEAGRASEVLGR